MSNGNIEGKKLSKEEKIKSIEYHVAKILEALGLDLSDNNIKNTPKRVSKMFVNEIFSGLSSELPKFSSFENNYNYNQMLVEKNITLYSTCEHHLLPIVGKAHLAYISSGKIIGLSKMNRIVEYYSKRPQVQERLTIQIANALQDLLKTEDVACIIDAKHLCVSCRGIRDVNSSTITAEYQGKFKDYNIRKELFLNINAL